MAESPPVFRCGPGTNIPLVVPICHELWHAIFAGEDQQLGSVHLLRSILLHRAIIRLSHRPRDLRPKRPRDRPPFQGPMAERPSKFSFLVWD